MAQHLTSQERRLWRRCQSTGRMVIKREFLTRVGFIITSWIHRHLPFAYFHDEVIPEELSANSDGDRPLPA